MYKGVDADYYGFRDDEDGSLEALELKAEQQGPSLSLSPPSSLLFLPLLSLPSLFLSPTLINNHTAVERAEAEYTVRQKRRKQDESAAVPSPFTAHVPVPSKEQVEKMLLDKRKEVCILFSLCFVSLFFFFLCFLLCYLFFAIDNTTGVIEEICQFRIDRDSNIQLNNHHLYNIINQTKAAKATPHLQI